MLANGADLMAVSKLLGHSTTTMTVNQYYHLLDGEKRKAINKLPTLGSTGRSDTLTGRIASGVTWLNL